MWPFQTNFLFSHWLTLFKPLFNCESTSEPSTGIVKTMREGSLTALFPALVLTPDDSWRDTWQRADTGHGQMWHNNWGSGRALSRYLQTITILISMDGKNMKIIHKHKKLNVHYFVSDYEKYQMCIHYSAIFAIFVLCTYLLELK